MRFLRHADLLGLGNDPRFGLGAIGQLGGVNDGPVKAAGPEDFLTGGLVFDLATHGDAGHKLADGLEPVTRDGEGGQHQNTIRTRLLSRGHHGPSRLDHHRSSGAKDADDGVGSLHGLGDHCAVGCVALDNVEVGVGQREGLRGPSKCRDLVASGDCLLDQRNAGRAGGAQDGEVHGPAPFIPGGCLTRRPDVGTAWPTTATVESVGLAGRPARARLAAPSAWRR